MQQIYTLLIGIWQWLEQSFTSLDLSSLGDAIEKSWSVNANPLDLAQDIPAGLMAFVIIGAAILAFLTNENKGNGSLGGCVVFLLMYGVILSIIAGVLRWLWAYLFAPIGYSAYFLGRILLASIFVFCVFYGGFITIIHYISSIFLDTSSQGSNSIRKQRSYLFGPCYVSTMQTIAHAWQANWRTFTNAVAFVKKRSAKRKSTFAKIIIWCLGCLYVLGVLFSVLFIGSIIMVLCMLVHLAIIVPVILVGYILYGAIWLLDYVYSTIKSRKSVCPHCQNRSFVPQHKCPSCSALHADLSPSSYGILYRRCDCGARLPSSFITGRSSLVPVCPKCSKDMHSSKDT